MSVPELLAPAGELDKLRTCLVYGADAVYLGGRGGNLRAACRGFGPEELRLALSEASAFGARIYYCLNSIATERDLRALPARIEDAAEAGVHGFIIADPGVLRLARRYAPGVEVHLSTQANSSNSESMAFWAGQGVGRVNLARELDCREIHDICRARRNMEQGPGGRPMELEVFVHGAMCLAVSGHCLLSAWLNARSGNQGRCTQPCRFEYRALESPLVVEERTRPGEPLWRVEQGEDFSSFWATSDLCLLPWLGWFAANGVDAIKIEGRMKSAGYLAHVVDAYRVFLDALRAGAGSENPAAHGRTNLLRDCMTELYLSATRPLDSGFFLHGRRRNLTREFIVREAPPTRPNRSGEGELPELGRQVLARVAEPLGPGAWLVDLRGNWERARDVELMLPGLARPLLAGGAYGLENQRGEAVKMLGNGVRAVFRCEEPGLAPGMFIRAAPVRGRAFWCTVTL
ncbi:U32 family peptidase [Desulfovibrio sp. OttesenSCG-928-A18]|nr:U32 family peptidase [Desulfovibrio sp. OttesenSCG-928-A18]